MVYSPPYSSTEGLVAVGACFDGTDGLPAHKSIGRARGLLIGSSGLFEALITIQPAAQLRSSSTPSLDMRLSRKIQGGPHTAQIFGRYPEFSCKICLQIKLHFSLNVFHTVYNALQVYLRAVWMPLQRQAQHNRNPWYTVCLVHNAASKCCKNMPASWKWLPKTFKCC